MNRLRQIGVFLMVLLVLAGTTGFNAWHHICACRPVVEVKVHSCCEPVEETPSCCDTEAPAPVRTTDACGTGCTNDHKGCRDVPVYFKASIVAVPLVQKVTLPELAQLAEIVIPFIPAVPGETADGGFTLAHNKPPPRAGKELVFYLHQLRIPFSA
jgi:hypothetical protein